MFKIISLESISRQGKRNSNEDYIAWSEDYYNCRFPAFVLCDGVGGLSHGGEASKMACEGALRYLALNKPMRLSREYINRLTNSLFAEFDRYVEAAVNDIKEIGSTFTMVIKDNKKIWFVHIGDSRIYLIRPKERRIVFCTEDHSLVHELVRDGIIESSDAKNHYTKNVITKAIMPKNGKSYSPSVHCETGLIDGDVILMCSDGVLESFDNKLIVDVVCESENLKYMMSKIDAICSRGSYDNYSAILMEISVDEPEYSFLLRLQKIIKNWKNVFKKAISL